MGLRRILKTYFYKNKFKKNQYSIDFKRKNILVTGSNSGIGLALTKKLLNLENNVFGIFNKNSNNLDQIKNHNFKKIKCDLKNIHNYEEIEKNLKNINIDIVFNCAGLFGGSFDEQTIENLSFKNFNDVLMVNSLSVIKIMQILLKNSQPEIVVNISSEAGSVKQNKSGDAYIYRTSKSALNSITKNMSLDLNKKFGTTVIAIDPGNVATNMNPKGIIESQECANLILDLISNDVKKLNGKFINLLSQEQAW